MIDKKLDKVIEDLKNNIEKFKNKNIKTPDWEEVQKKKNLYVGYKEVTDANNQLNKLLVQVGDLIIALKDLKNSLKISDEMTPRLMKNIRNRLDKKISKLYQYQKVLSNEKDSYDQTLRFYHSAQYILGSPRLSGME